MERPGSEDVVTSAINHVDMVWPSQYLKSKYNALSEHSELGFVNWLRDSLI